MLRMQTQEGVNDPQHLLGLSSESSQRQRPYRSKKEQRAMRKRDKKKMVDTGQVLTETETETETDAESMTGSGAPEATDVSCNYPAPVVVNGASYCGCQLPPDHEGAHQVNVTWQR